MTWSIFSGIVDTLVGNILHLALHSSFLTNLIKLSADQIIGIALFHEDVRTGIDQSV
jgi:hypothetical protein